MANELYLKALNRYKSLSFPTKKDEHWRFADFKFWSNPELLKGLKSFEDFCLDEYSSKFFNTLLNGRKFDAYLAANFDDLNIVKVEKSESKVLSGKFFSKINIFILEEDSQLEILSENFEESQNFKLQANAFFLSKNSKLKLNSINASAASQYQRNDFFISENSSVSDVYIEAGLNQTRTERNFNILGENVKVDSAVLTKSVGEITHDVRTSQIHSCGKSHSNVLIKSIIDDTSKLAFMGLIDVCEAAQKTEAYQSSRSMLLSKKAKAQASPILEIMANDVVCSHGCAVARPDKEQIFYMKSRGLSEKESQQLLVKGFANEVIDRISNDDFRAVAHSKI